MNVCPCAVIDAVSADDAGVLAAILDPSLCIIRSGRLALIACACDSRAPDPGQVVRWMEQLHHRLDLVPLQYGERFDSHEQAMDLLAKSETHLSESLDRIRGMTEFGIRILTDFQPQMSSPTPAAASSGAMYLRARAEQQAAAEGLTLAMKARIREWIGGLPVRPTRLRFEGASRLVPHPAVLLLVSRADARAFAEQYAARCASLEYVTRLTGPWAPYSFVRAADSLEL